VVFGAWITLRWGGVSLTEGIDDIGEAAVAFLAAGVCGLAAWRHRGRIRVAWILIGVSAFLWAAGETVWSFYEVGLRQQVPYPSLADAGYLGAMPFAVAGILLFAAANRRTISRLAGVLDGAVIAGSLLVVSWGTILGTVYRAGSDSLTSQLIGLAYPVSDVIVLTMVLLLVGRVHRSAQLPLSLLAAGLLANLLADSGFAYLTTVNTYGPAQPIDTGWVAGYMLIALAALRAAQVPVARSTASDVLARRWRQFLPYIPVAAAAAVTVGSNLVTGSIDPLLFWGLMVVALFVVMRQFIMLTDNMALNRKLESQAAELREREEHLRSLVEHSSDVVTVTDREGIIRFQSTSAERIFAYAPAELVGHRLLDLVHPADRRALQDRLDEVLKASAHPTSVDCRLRHKLGRLVPLSDHDHEPALSPQRPGPGAEHSGRDRAKRAGRESVPLRGPRRPDQPGQRAGLPGAPRPRARQPHPRSWDLGSVPRHRRLQIDQRDLWPQGGRWSPDRGRRPARADRPARRRGRAAAQR